MTTIAPISERLIWAEESILQLFMTDPSPKTIIEIRRLLNSAFGKNIIRVALENLYQEKKLFKLLRKSNTFVFRLPDVNKDKWWLRTIKS